MPLVTTGISVHGLQALIKGTQSAYSASLSPFSQDPDARVRHRSVTSSTLASTGFSTFSFANRARTETEATWNLPDDPPLLACPLYRALPFTERRDGRGKCSC